MSDRLAGQAPSAEPEIWDDTSLVNIYEETRERAMLGFTGVNGEAKL